MSKTKSDLSSDHVGRWRILLLKEDTAQADIGLAMGESFLKSIGIRRPLAQVNCKSPDCVRCTLVQVARGLTGTLVQLVCFIPEGEGFIQTLFFAL